jgi:hypothetical protein
MRPARSRSRASMRKPSSTASSSAATARSRRRVRDDLCRQLRGHRRAARGHGPAAARRRHTQMGGGLPTHTAARGGPPPTSERRGQRDVTRRNCRRGPGREGAASDCPRPSLAGEAAGRSRTSSGSRTAARRVWQVGPKTLTTSHASWVALDPAVPVMPVGVGSNLIVRDAACRGWWCGCPRASPG